MPFGRQFHVAHALRAQLLHKAPHALGQVDVGNQEFQVFGRNDRCIDCIARRSIVEDIQHLEGHIFGNLLLGLDGAAAEVGCQDQVGTVAQRAVSFQRFMAEDVQRSAGDVAAAQGLGQRLLRRSRHRGRR